MGTEDRAPRTRNVLESIKPHPGSFDASAMARGEPGVPRRFDWRGTTYVVVEVLATGREIGNYSNTPGDSYVRRHTTRVRTESGEVMVLSASRGKRGTAARWTLRHIEVPPDAPA